MSALFSPLTLRALTIPNRAWVSPMCQYSADDGLPNDWHLVHLGSRAVGGAGLVMAEATAVSPDGRISPGDTGLWSPEQASAWRQITDFIRGRGSVSGIQLGHAGRKASTYRPWEGHGTVPAGEGGWTTVAPSPIAFEGYDPPREMTTGDLEQIKDRFVAAARLALSAGFDVIEVHAAHGYLLHQFLSPIANRRTDEYGGDFAGRTRLLLEVVSAVREVWPEERPLFVRVSATDWVDGGWSLDDTVELARLLGQRGVDLIDCSTGGLVPNASIPMEPGYQVRFARAVRHGAGIATAAVGWITETDQAAAILADGSADAVFLARELLRNPYWPLEAARLLGDDPRWPVQYERAKPRAAT